MFGARCDVSGPRPCCTICLTVMHVAFVAIPPLCYLSAELLRARKKEHAKSPLPSIFPEIFLVPAKLPDEPCSEMLEASMRIGGRVEFFSRRNEDEGCLRR